MNTPTVVRRISALLLFSLSSASALSRDTLALSLPTPEAYTNQAVEGSYVNPTWVGEVPEWNYYDVFGNHLLEGFYLFGLSMHQNQDSGNSMVTLHPFLSKWLNGMVQVGDLTDKRGILAMIGERISTRFTPYTYNQSLFCGVRLDAFFDFFHGTNEVSLITSRISNTGIFGMLSDAGVVTDDADWLHGIHIAKKIKDIGEIGGTYINLHHQDGSQGNTLSGALEDSLPPTSPTGLTIVGVDGRCALKAPKFTMYGEYARSQEVLGGYFKPRAGNLGFLNFHWDVLDGVNCGGEGYLVQAAYKTAFSCPAHVRGDRFGSGKYLYSLVEDNDDEDDYPENGRSKLNAVPEGDRDGTIPAGYDKDKNGKYDHTEDFLNYDADPPKSVLYFDRNNNDVPDAVEDDPYPDYPIVPGYYLPGERYLRYDEMAERWRVDTSDGQVSKGLLGFHLKARYQFHPKLGVTIGGLYERSEKNSFQTIYRDTTPLGTVYEPENASAIYSLIQFRHDFASDKRLTVDNYLSKVNDNIPNHTVTATIGRSPTTGATTSLFQTVVDELDYRDAVVEMLVAEYSIYRNRGFNLTSRGNIKYQKHFPHLKYNYAEKNVFSAMLVNKCHYTWLVPVLKDMFLIPKYKNVIDYSGYGPRTVALDHKYRHSTMMNAAYLVYEWKFTRKTSITTGVQCTDFMDFNNNDEDYFHANWTLQLMMKDRYSGLNVILTAGFAKYNYVYYNAPRAVHNPSNNPHGVTADYSSYDVFVKVHCGF